MIEHTSIRRATVDDVPLITEQRRLMYLEIGHPDNDILREMLEKFAVWILSGIATEQYLGWLAITNEARVAGGAGLLVHDWFIKPDNMTGKQGYIGNVDVIPEYRNHGIARRLMDSILDWCRENQLGTLTLHTSERARTLYESLGFETPGNCMELKMKGHPRDMDAPSLD
jgi:GNAT superfamily N-acetyltransferase